MTLTDIQDPTSNLEALVGEGKKYRDVEALAKGYINADMQLHNMTDKLDTIQESIRDRQSQDIKIDKIVEHINKPDVSGVNPDRTNTQPSVQPQSGPTRDEIEQMVSTAVVTANTAKSHSDNNAIATEKMIAHYGSIEAAQVAIAKVHNNDPEMKKVLDQLAGVNPDKAVALVLSSNPQEKPEGITVTSMPGISPDSANAIVVSEGGLTWTQCRELRKKAPQQYNSPEFRMKMEAVVAKHEAEGKDFFAT